MNILKAYIRFFKIKSGIKTVDYKKGIGFYLPIGLYNYNPIGKIHRINVKGKVGLYELLKYKAYRDPEDMIEYSLWHFIGYENNKRVKDCTFKEYISIYII